MSAKPALNIIVGFALISTSALVSALSYLRMNAPVDHSTIAAVPHEITPAPNLIPVVTARHPIKRGQRVNPDSLSQTRIEPPLPAGALSNAAGISNAVALRDIPKGQIITEDSLQRGDDARPGISVLVPPGLRAVALRVNDEIAVGNFIRPNDRVDINLVLPSARVARVLGKDIRRDDHTESSVLLQNVLILSTGDTLDTPAGENAVPMKNITVAVSPADALLLGIAIDAGKFYLTLRNPTDEGVVVTNRKHMRDLLGPAPAPRSTPRPSPTRKQTVYNPKPPGRTVTIFRGKDSSTVTFPPDHEP